MCNEFYKIKTKTKQKKKKFEIKFRGDVSADKKILLIFGMDHFKVFFFFSIILFFENNFSKRKIFATCFRFASVLWLRN